MYDIKTYSTIQSYKCKMCGIDHIKCVDYNHIIVAQQFKGSFTIQQIYLLHNGVLNLKLTFELHCGKNSQHCNYHYHNGKLFLTRMFAIFALAFLHDGNALFVDHTANAMRCKVPLKNGACIQNWRCDSECKAENTQYCSFEFGKSRCKCKMGYSGGRCQYNNICQNVGTNSSCEEGICRKLHLPTPTNDCICLRHKITGPNCSKLNLEKGRVFLKPRLKTNLYSYRDSLVGSTKRSLPVAIFVSKYLIIFVPHFLEGVARLFTIS